MAFSSDVAAPCRDTRDEIAKMRLLAPLAAIAALTLSLAACETYYAYGYVDGYYDDFYGPWYDGYWGPGDVFFYRTGPRDHFHRDDGGHFRHMTSGGGFHSFHARAAAPAARGGTTAAPRHG